MTAQHARAGEGTFQASQRGSLRRPQAMMVGSSLYARPVSVLRRVSVYFTFSL